ncbi:hypothetical protein [Motilibacter rhizosphaerae]|uniref:hypothetical protein n=1 Tax=Motilibacter rhizosphaerae TaxID=598652 RepID=UPI0013EED64C|nr:hypothetical protein [Motilibacter rhizosphaerae]
MGEQRSRLWQMAESLGVVEDSSKRPTRGSSAWWRRLAGLVLAIVVAPVVVALLQR